MSRFALTILFLLIAAKSCFYVDNNSYYVDIETDYFPTVLIASNFDTIDTITIVDSLLFKYEISIDTGTLFFADLFLDNLQLLRSDTIADSLWLYPGYINNRETYDITLRAYYRTYTGSLADIMNAEFFQADTSWTVQFFKNQD
jgi:hypothetical protein